MADPSDKSIEFPAGELREITLRIPGEHFFCDTIDIPASLKPDKYEDFIEFVLNEEIYLRIQQINWLGGFKPMSRIGKFYFRNPS